MREGGPTCSAALVVQIVVTLVLVGVLARRKDPSSSPTRAVDAMVPISS